VADKINVSGLDLSASVVYDGSAYHLVINGNDSGQKNAITFTDSGTGLGLDVAANTKVSAQDAQLQVDKLAVTSATNTVTGIIPGVTLTLNGTSANDYSLGVVNDPTKLQNSLQAVVTAYNAVMGEVNQQMPQPGSTTQLGANTLVGDPAMLQLQSMMLDLPITTGGPAGNTYTMLSDIGINVDSTGTMSLDTNKLQAALTNDPTAVTNLLVGTNGTNGLASALANTISTFTDPVDGVLQADSQGIAQQISSQNDDIAQMNTMAQAYQQSLQTQFSAMEQLISSYQGQTSSLAGLTGLTSSPSTSTSASSNSSSSATSSTS
jgi:flagellar hook-associated protein 2